MSNELVFGCVETIETPEQYRQLIADNCLPADQTEVAGVPRNARFESLTAEQITALNEWFMKHGKLFNLRLSTTEMCLAVLGAEEVDGAKSEWNLQIEKQFFDCKANRHNRLVKTGNLGDLSKEGIIHDIANGYWGYGPVGHIDCWGEVLNLQHRDIAKIKANLKLGEDCPTIDILTMLNMPPQLAATIDRGAEKSKADQEYIDKEQFNLPFVESVILDATGEDYIPKNFPRFRNGLAKTLVTTRHNVYSRFLGTGYHPSKANQPSARQALALQSCFDRREGGDALQELVLKTTLAGTTESGSPALWVKHLSPAMVATAIVLASNSDQDGPWVEPTADSEGSPIEVSETVSDTILGALGSVSDKGEDPFSSYVREVAKIKKDPNKPSGMDRWVFWGLVGLVRDVLADEWDSTTPYFPRVNATLVKRIKDGKVAPPVFGGYDAGPSTDETESDE